MAALKFTGLLFYEKIQAHSSFFDGTFFLPLLSANVIHSVVFEILYGLSDFLRRSPSSDE